MRFHSRHIEKVGYSAVCDIYGIQLLNTHELKQLKGGGGKAVKCCMRKKLNRVFIVATASNRGHPGQGFPPELFTML